MNLSDINPNLPCLRPLTSSQSQRRRMSCSTTSKSTNSSSNSSSNYSKTANSLPILIQLCIYPNEEYSCETIKTLFSSRQQYSANVADEFGCNLLMYTLRYQRLQLFDYLFNEISLDLDFKAKDRQGNTILHYAIIYASNQTAIFEQLIDKFIQYGIDIDQRNVFGFTPLLLACFCGRYDLVLSLLTRSEASPFVQDYIQIKNLLDFIDQDFPNRDRIRKYSLSDRPSSSNRQLIRIRVRLYQTIPCLFEQNHQSNKNFFEDYFLESIQDRSGQIRSVILKLFSSNSFAKDLLQVIRYIHRRYPKIQIPKRQQPNLSQITTTTTQLFLQRENSKSDIHQIFSLFDPDLRAKAITPKESSFKVYTGQTPQISTPPIQQMPILNVKPPPPTFKRLGTKITMLAALSRSTSTGKRRGSIQITDSK